jgi:NADH dehydrogenase (ubiquinone) flavoprotein 2
MFLLKQLYRVPTRQLALRSVAVQRPFSAFVNHRNTEDNNEETPFEFTKENYEKIKQLMKKYPANYKESSVIPALFIA